MNNYELLFRGEHWDVTDRELNATEFQIVFNYCRAIVLKYAAMLSQAPSPRVPAAGLDTQTRIRSSHREQFLRALWPEFLSAWTDVELNASKKSYGVLQVLWFPASDQPKTVTVGKGDDAERKTQYTENPFRFRSIEPHLFYPVYRTMDNPNDFLYVIRFDPERLVEDIEEQYGVSLQPTDLFEGTDGTCDLIEYWDNKRYILISTTKTARLGQRGESVEEETVTVLKDFKHKYSTIPFFVLQNVRNPGTDPTDGGSLSDIDSVSSLNKHFNEMFSEAAEEIVTNIHRPLVYKSDAHTQDPQDLEFTSGAVYPIGNEEELDTLDWSGMPIAVQQHLATLITGIQELSFIGAAGFGQYPEGASGVGLRMVLQSIEQIMELKVPIRIRSIQAICKLLFQLFEERASKSPDDKPTPLVLWTKTALGRYGNVIITAEDIQGDYFVTVDYGNLLPRNETEHQQNEVYKFKTGTVSLLKTLDNIGVEDPDAELAHIKEEMQDPILNPEKVMAVLQIQKLRMELEELKRQTDAARQQQQQQQQMMGAG